MCGIVGYIGKRKAYPILIKGLKRLEYRGYDSAGVALISDNQQLNVYKTKGKVSELENFVTHKDISGTVGIAHTRWATHGEPCSANAHPHYSSSSLSFTTVSLKTTLFSKKNFRPKVTLLKVVPIPRCLFN